MSDKKVEVLLLHVYRPFGKQLERLYEYGESGKPYARQAEWVGCRLDDLAIAWTKFRWWLRENRTAFFVGVFVFGVLCVGVPWAAEVWL